MHFGPFFSLHCTVHTEENAAKMNSNNNDLQSAHDLDPQSTPRSHPQIQPRPQQRRPRGFAATAITSGGSGKGKKERENDKERTKLRERHRRAITSRMLAGLRQCGNFPLPARADMNDVLAALAREAGWTVDADGTTYRLNPMGSHPVMPVKSQLSASSLQNSSMEASLDFQSTILRIDENFSPASLDSVVVPDMDRGDKIGSDSIINSPEPLEHDQLMQEGEQGKRFSGTSYVPVYVALGVSIWFFIFGLLISHKSKIGSRFKSKTGIILDSHFGTETGIINNFCQLVDREGVRQKLRHLKSLHVDGVLVDCWWGIVEGWSPQKYEWSGYKELFKIIKEFDLKLQVGLAFHECGANDSGDAIIPLPQWVIEIGKENQDIFFTYRDGRRDTECLSWGIDKERILKGRTGVEVYYDLMRSFRTEFDDLFAEGLITAVEIGMGASGELKYPSFSERMGWKYPGIGEFQCYDKYLQKNLQKAAKLRGHSSWARGPDNAGHYNSRPHETGFFCEEGDYDSYYGRFFLQWYSQSLVDHANNVLTLASLAFEDIKIVVKIPAVYWWYKCTSHAAELTAGYYNPTNKDGYAPLFDLLKKYFITIKFVCSGLQRMPHEIEDASADPEGLCWQVLNSARERGLNIAGQNAFPCYHSEDFMKIVETAKQRNDPDRHHFEFFTFQNLLPLVGQTSCFSELDYLIKCMHGETAS